MQKEYYILVKTAYALVYGLRFFVGNRYKGITAVAQVTAIKNIKTYKI